MFEMKTPPPDGTLLEFGIRYHGSTSGRVYTYAALCIGGRWFFTGSGPTDAGWGAVQRWLDDGSREVAWVRVVTETRRIWTAPETPSPSPSPVRLRRADETPEERSARRRATGEWGPADSAEPSGL